MQRAEEELTIKREAMMAELRNTSAQLALDIAKRVLERELEGEANQQKYAEDLANKAKLN
jgi:F0F1-type ATP synthase membrane subunit b/b'